MKTCTKCSETKDVSVFQKDKSRKDGLQPWCKTCISLSNKKNYSANKTSRQEIKKAYNKRNRDKLNAYERSYHSGKKGSYAFKCAKYRAAKLLATPSWLTEEQLREIENIYATCPKGYEVDHVVPLRGDNVSGLHVGWNLQHLPKTDNRRKNNKLIGDTKDEN